MSSPTPWLIAAVLALAAPSGAQALCAYQGELSAETTVAQEFADSDWVVRARVVSSLNSWEDDVADDDESDPWTTYRVEVVETFKGAPPSSFTVFTERNSGGFYLDADGDYLLFLRPAPDWLEAPAARGAMVVNYSCGRSGLWAQAPQANRLALAALAEPQ